MVMVVRRVALMALIGGCEAFSLLAAPRGNANPHASVKMMADEPDWAFRYSSGSRRRVMSNGGASSAVGTKRDAMARRAAARAAAAAAPTPPPQSTPDTAKADEQTAVPTEPSDDHFRYNANNPYSTTVGARRDAVGKVIVGGLGHHRPGKQ
jgi:hypothetical protein